MIPTKPGPEVGLGLRHQITPLRSVTCQVCPVGHLDLLQTLTDFVNQAMSRTKLNKIMFIFNH